MDNIKQGRFRKPQINFTIISNSIIKDSTISLKAKGLYAVIRYYISIPNFELYKSFLERMSKDGRDGFNSAWKELKDKGYLKVYKIRVGHGRFVYEYDLLDEPEVHLNNNNNNISTLADVNIDMEDDNIC